MDLNLSIEINEEMFSKMCEDTLESLPEEKMQEILLKAVEVALLEKNQSFYGTSILTDQYRRPTELMNNILKKANFEKYFEPMAQKITNHIIENYQSIITEAISKTFFDVLFTSENKYQFRDNLYSAIRTNFK